MALATATPDGAPSVRMVLLKGHGPDAASSSTPMPKAARAGRSCANPQAALLFHWKSLRRQIRIEGPLSEVTRGRGRRLFPFARPRRRSSARPPPTSRARSIAAQTYLDRVEELRSALRGQGSPAPAALDRLPPDARSAIEFWLDRAQPPARTPPLHARCRTAAGPARCSTHDARSTPRAPADPQRRASPRSRWRRCSAALKIWAVWQTDSTAMLGSLADTALDLVASVATLVGVWIAAQPADEDHRFGHGKAEALAAMFQVMLIALSASGHRLSRGQRAGSGGRRDAAAERRHRRLGHRDRRAPSRCSPGSAT